jgi:hypothetical protein
MDRGQLHITDGCTSGVTPSWGRGSVGDARRASVRHCPAAPVPGARVRETAWGHGPERRKRKRVRHQRCNWNRGTSGYARPPALEAVAGGGAHSRRRRGGGAESTAAARAHLEYVSQISPRYDGGRPNGFGLQMGRGVRTAHGWTL